MVRQTALSWVVPRNGQMYGIRGKAGTAPGEGLWERGRNSERMEAKGGEEGRGRELGLVFQEKALLLLAVVLQGDTTATEDHFTCFMQAY